MSEGTKIQWCDDTWNFSIGCTKVSPGCQFCYAEVSTPVRVARSKGKELWGGTLRQRASVATFNAPLRWNEKAKICNSCGAAHKTSEGYELWTICCSESSHKNWHRRRVFSLSLGDWLDEAIPIETLADALDVIRQCPNLDFLLLTKRPENWHGRLFEIIKTTKVAMLDAYIAKWLRGDAPPNIWIGATVENQEYAGRRIPELLKIPAVCRFISYEPALGPVDFGKYIPAKDEEGDCTQCGLRFEADELSSLHHECPPGFQQPNIHQIIVGGESGSKARPFNVAWARSTIAQCTAAGVACFVKQMGAKPFGNNDDAPYVDIPLNLKDKKGGDMMQWPDGLQVREFPIIAR